MSNAREAMRRNAAAKKKAAEVGEQVQQDQQQSRQQASKVLSRKMQLVRCSLDPADVKAMDTAALRAGLARSAWMRRAILEAIERERR